MAIVLERRGQFGHAAALGKSGSYMGGFMALDFSDPNDQLILEANMSAVQALDCNQLREWLRVMDNDLSPYKLPQFVWFGHLFTEYNGTWPIADDLTKRVFRQFAEAKLALC